MKRFITVLSSLLVLPAFAEVAPMYYDEVIEYTDDAINDEDNVVQSTDQGGNTNKNVAQRTNINRSTSASRAISSASNAASSRTNASSRAVASSRSTTARTTTNRSTRTQNVVSRGAATASRNASASRRVQTNKPVTARVSANSTVMNRSTPSYAQQTVLGNDSGLLYNPSSTSSRVGMANRRSTARLSTVTTQSTPTITQEDVTATTNNLTAIQELTDYCKAQYAACMDNYCNVLDDNQGRCSCSKNIKNYEKTEDALTQASEEFQDVVQKIRYIGLTSDQIESLFTETEAELSMKGTSDSSRLKSSLDAIKKKIVDVSSPNSSSLTATNGISLDLNGLLSADFTSGFDLNSFLGTTGVNTSSVSNQRGDQLYKTAANRCKTAVLNSCTAQGIDANVITNSYDLEIDKQCIAYERSLNEANTEMRNNVTNAKNILQQARLLLAQNKNSYDLRSCVAAIDSCMQDEYVCGSDYESCLDPTGKYLANGEIVKGGTPGVAGGQPKNTVPVEMEQHTYYTGTVNNNGMLTINNSIPSITTQDLENWTSGGMYNLYSTWNYKKDNNDMNAWSFGNGENLGAYIDDALTTWKSEYNKSDSETKTENMAIYLLQKIGYIDSSDNDKVHGMCASVMKQCQDYTYKNKKYQPVNEVVRQYLNNTLAKIKVKQDAILTDYAEGCRADVQSCLSTNGYDESNTASTASKTAVNACSQEITTCMSVGGYQIDSGVRLSLRAMTDWVASMLLTCSQDSYLDDNGENNATCKSCPVYPTFWSQTNNNGEVIVKLCQEGNNEVNANCNGRGNVQTSSAGGRVTECSCPDGYRNYTRVDTNGNETRGCLQEE